MYRLFELFGTKWIDVLDVLTLEEIKKQLVIENKKEGLKCFRIDNEEIPIIFCQPTAADIKYFIENVDILDQSIMYMHNTYEKTYHRVVSSRPSRKKKEIRMPKKTTRKHLKKMELSNKRKKRFYGAKYQ